MHFCFSIFSDAFLANNLQVLQYLNHLKICNMYNNICICHVQNHNSHLSQQIVFAFQIYKYYLAGTTSDEI